MHHRGVCLPEVATLLAEANERIGELEKLLAQRSPNVLSVGDTVWTNVWDPPVGYQEGPVTIVGFDRGTGMVKLVDGFGNEHFRPFHKIRRQPNEWG